jgi:NAD(P)-dependent dehydrogenase (short-subunit alcohol dehydrogenase family)
LGRRRPGDLTVRDFAGRTAVITGAASGIGRGMAIVFAAEGMRLVISDVEGPALAETADALLAAGAEVLAMETDVADRWAVAALAEAARARFGPVHLLCNNAGVSHARRGIHATHEDWEWMLGVNLWGVVHGVESFLPGMLAHGQPAHIVNTASINAIFPSRMSAMYSTTKYGVLGLTETLRNELAGTTVGVSAFCPAAVTTRIGASARNRPAHLEAPTSPPPHVPSSEFPAGPPIPPEEAARMVLNGVRRGQLHIFTDPLIRPYIEARHAAMMAEFAVLDDWLAAHDRQS